MPRRIQRKRTKGWRLADHSTNAVCVGRGSKYGNPAQEGLTVIVVASHPGEPPSFTSRPATREDVVGWFVDCVEDDPLRNLGWTIEEARLELGGKDLICWCPLDAACHADVLLALVNPDPPGADFPAAPGTGEAS